MFLVNYIRVYQPGNQQRVDDQPIDECDEDSADEYTEYSTGDFINPPVGDHPPVDDQSSEVKVNQLATTTAGDHRGDSWGRVNGTANATVPEKLNAALHLGSNDMRIILVVVALLAQVALFM